HESGNNGQRSVSGKTERMTDARTALAWLERFAVRIEFQQLPPSRRRRKNRVILQFSDVSGRVETCGGTTLLGAVNRARLRRDLGELNPSRIVHPTGAEI